MKKKIGKVAIGIFIVVIIAFFLIIGPYGIAIKPYAEYLRYKDVAAEVEAEISYINVYEDSDDNKQYELYMTYTYDGVPYEDIYWETVSADRYNMGDIVSIKILPENPTYIMSTEIGTIGMNVTMLLYSIALAGLIYERSFYCTKENSGKRYITDKMLATSLRPRAFLAIAQVLIFTCSGIYSAKLFMPELVGNLTLANVLLAAGVLFVCITVIKTLNLPKKGFVFGVHRCVSKWNEDGNDTTISHTRFDRIDKTNHGGKVFDRAIEGFQYYVVQNSKGYVCEIFDITRWTPKVEDRSLKSGSKFAVIRMFIELIIGIGFMIAFTYVFRMIAHLVA